MYQDNTEFERGKRAGEREALAMIRAAIQAEQDRATAAGRVANVPDGDLDDTRIDDEKLAQRLIAVGLTTALTTCNRVERILHGDTKPADERLREALHKLDSEPGITIAEHVSQAPELAEFLPRAAQIKEKSR